MVLKYNLIQENKNEVLYEYFPEGSDAAVLIQAGGTDDWDKQKYVDTSEKKVV